MSVEQWQEFKYNQHLALKASHQRFDYALATLCFATLALSLQFSIREYSTYRWLLVASWGVYLVACALVGWRLLASLRHSDLAQRIRALEEDIGRRRGWFRNSSYLKSLEAGDRLSAMGDVLTVAGETKLLKAKEGELAEAQKEHDKLEKDMRTRFAASLLALFAGLAMNGVYISINFLEGPGRAQLEEVGNVGESNQPLQTDAPRR